MEAYIHVHHPKELLGSISDQPYFILV